MGDLWTLNQVDYIVRIELLVEMKTWCFQMKTHFLLLLSVTNRFVRILKMLGGKVSVDHIRSPRAKDYFPFDSSHGNIQGFPQLTAFQWNQHQTFQFKRSRVAEMFDCHASHLSRTSLSTAVTSQQHWRCAIYCQFHQFVRQHLIWSIWSEKTFDGAAQQQQQDVHALQIRL